MKETLNPDSRTRECGTLHSVMVSKIDLQTCKSEFKSHWVPHSFNLVLHLSKTLSKLLPENVVKGKKQKLPDDD